MKLPALLGLMIGVSLFVSCETTEMTSDRGNQEAKRQAALAEAREHGQPDEAQRNLWNTQNDVLNRDGNSARQF